MRETTAADEPLGLIFDIQGFSVHDGPGCRTLVFLSGCPLSCSWCSNPEGLAPRPRLLYRAAHCQPRRRGCIDACPAGAIRLADDGAGVHIDRSRCTGCLEMPCVEACYRGALQRAGRPFTVSELMRLLMRDRDFWGSGGGVTFGGGEPLFQATFLEAVLRRCREVYLHTAIETSGHAPTPTLLAVLPLLDWIFIDLKHMSSATHRQQTGVGNELILNNLATLAASDWPGRLIVRIPLVPGFNDSQENLEASAAFLAEHGLHEVNLVPFHRLATSKYEQLGEPYRWAGVDRPQRAEMEAAAALMADAGLRCYVDDGTPF
jgi:pyruvate formate lyase activating enzyme